MNSPIEPHVGCIQSAMDIIGNKWTALLLRDLADGPKRFSEFQRSVALNPRTLTQRLDALIEHSIIEPCDITNTTYKSYRLTHKGEDLLPILESMAAWGNKYPRATSIDPSSAPSPNIA